MQGRRGGFVLARAVNLYIVRRQDDLQVAQHKGQEATVSTNTYTMDPKLSDALARLGNAIADRKASKPGLR